MRNPFERMRVAGKSSKATNYNEGDSFVHPESMDHSVSFSPTLQYDWAIDPPTTDKHDESKNTIKGVVHLVRKLNCGKISSKERRESMKARKQIEALRLQGYEIDPMDWRNAHVDDIWSAKPSPTCNPFSREVNITVEAGNAPGSFVEVNRPMRQSSFTDFGRAIQSARFPTTDKRMGNESLKQKKLVDEQSLQKVGVDPVTIRKERWLKLIQQGWEDDNERAIVFPGDDSTAHESSRRGDSATSYSGDTEYTTESDDSDPSHRRHDAAWKQSLSNRSTRRKASVKPKRRVKSFTENDLWAGVAEDFGIFAGLILSDGGACVGTISDIAHETVADSCNSANAQGHLDALYRIDGMDLSLLEGE